MTTPALLARSPRRPYLHGTSLLVVALLLFFAKPGAAADGIARSALSRALPSTIDSTVTKVTGTVLELVGGQMQIDVAGAIITSGDAPDAGPLPSTAIPVGARVVAQVTILQPPPPVSFPPPPLPATSVVVFLPRDGRLSGTIEGVDATEGTFGMFYRSISTSPATTWSGFGPKGPVRGIADLAAGMYASVAVVVEGSGLLAVSVDAVGLVTPPHLVAFRGPVQSIAATEWKIDDRLVEVDSATKIVGDPKVGETVDVVAEAPALPTSTANTTLVALSITLSSATGPPHD